MNTFERAWAHRDQIAARPQRSDQLEAAERQAFPPMDPGSPSS
ncbi:MAG: hypothetical protein AAF799_25470 [Myxococcota bacterium]